MSPLHIGTISFDWYPFHPRVRALAEAAADAGYKVDVICLRQPDEKRFEVYEGVNVYRVPMSREFGGSLLMTIVSWCQFLLLSGFVVTRLHLKQRYHVIHVHNMPDFLVFATLIPKILGAKIILDVQDASPELMADRLPGRVRSIAKFLATLQERISTAFADYVVTVGWTVEELLLKRSVSHKRLTSIHNSTNPKYFPISKRALPESTEDPRPFILMYHGTVAERQGLDVVIRALPLVVKEAPNVRFDIKGFRGDLMTQIKDLATELGVGERVVMSEPCPVGKVVDFIQHGDVGIIPYRPQGYMELVLPVKAFEYAWMHRPMIASDIRGIRSLFRPESVMYCDPISPESFAHAIIELYQHPEKREALAANAAKDYMPYQWEKEAERYQRLLATLVQKETVSAQEPTVYLPNRGDLLL